MESTLSLSRRDAWGLAGIVLLAILVRAAFWADAGSMPLVQVPTGDAATYVFLAEDIGQRGLLAPVGEPYRQAPLYPLLLWTLGTLGLDLTGVRVVQFLGGVLGVALLALLGRRWAGRIGFWTAGIGAAIYGPFVFYESDLLSIAPAVLLVEIALVLWGSTRRALAVGICLGLAALAQPNFLLAGLLAAGGSWLAPRLFGWGERRATVLLLVGLLLPPLVTFTRNLAVSGEPILISANGGINFFIGNNPEADGTFHLPASSRLLNRTEGLFTSARQVAEAQAGRGLSDAAVDRAWWLRGVDWWITDTPRAVGLTFGKLILALNNAEIPSHYDYEYFRGEVAVLRVLPTFGCLLPLGGIGLALLWRRRRDPLVLLFGAFVLSIIPFFITGRYRLPLAVFLVPAAGVTAAELWAQRRRARAWIPVGAAMAGYAILAFFPLYSTGTTRAHMLNVEGTTRVQQGDLDGAERDFTEALAIVPNHAEALNNLAYVAELRGNLDRALTLYEQAIAADPGQAETYLHVEDLHRKAGRPAAALEALDRLERARGGHIEDVASVVAYRRGVNSMSLGDTTAARTQLEAAVAANPVMIGGWMSLSALYRKLHLDEDALSASERALALNPDSPEALVNHARSLEELGRPEEALDSYVKALERAGPNPDLSLRIGQLYLTLDKLDEAEASFRAATRSRPHPLALLELGKLFERTRRLTEAKEAYREVVRTKSPQSAEARERLIALGVIRPNASR